MSENNTVSRRHFVGRIGLGLGYVGVSRDPVLWAQTAGPAAAPRPLGQLDEYDGFAKLAFNENPYGPPQSVLKAITQALKYANRYGYPDGGILEEIAKHHGVGAERRRATRHRSVPSERGAGRQAFSTDARASPHLGRHGGGDGPLPDRFQEHPAGTANDDGFGLDSRL